MSVVQQQQQSAEASKIVSEGEDFSDTVNDIANFEVNSLIWFESFPLKSLFIYENRPPNVCSLFSELFEFCGASNSATNTFIGEFSSILFDSNVISFGQSANGHSIENPCFLFAFYCGQCVLIFLYLRLTVSRCFILSRNAYHWQLLVYWQARPCIRRMSDTCVYMCSWNATLNINTGQDVHKQYTYRDQSNSFIYLLFDLMEIKLLE